MPIEALKSAEIIDQFAQLRLVVGYLGERKQSGWWDCDLLDATGSRFLENIFPRTARAAALRTTTEAACKVHDQALGRVGSYHLFRLPAALEDHLEHELAKMDWTEASKFIESREAAMDALKQLADAVIKAPAGPVQVGVERKILSATAINELAAHYHSAFQDGIRCFPYFAQEKHAR